MCASDGLWWDSSRLVAVRAVADVMRGGVATGDGAFSCGVISCSVGCGGGDEGGLDGTCGGDSCAFRILVLRVDLLGFVTSRGSGADA